MAENSTTPERPTRASGGGGWGGTVAVMIVAFVAIKFFGMGKQDTPIPPPAVRSAVQTPPVSGSPHESTNYYDVNSKPHGSRAPSTPWERGQPQGNVTPDQNQQLQQALLLESIRQRKAQESREYEKFNRSVEQARACQTCGGAGSYRFVDSGGNLQLRQCPKCQGSGRNW